MPIEPPPMKRAVAKSEQSPSVASVMGLSAEQLQDKGYLRDLALTELVGIVMRNRGDIKGVAACKELLDRTEGKVTEHIETTVTGTIVNFNVKEGSALILEGIREKLEKRRLLLIDSGSKSASSVIQPTDNQ